MNIIISSFPGERRLQSVFVPLFLGSTRAIYHANSTEYLFEAFTQTYTYNKRHGGRKQRTLRDSLGLLTRTGFTVEVQPRIQQRKQNCQYQEAPNRIQQAAGWLARGRGGDLLLECSRFHVLRRSLYAPFTTDVSREKELVTIFVLSLDSKSKRQLLFPI